KKYFPEEVERNWLKQKIRDNKIMALEEKRKRERERAKQDREQEQVQDREQEREQGEGTTKR
ncbi:MAG: hypothetical protein HN730_12400, partial [Bdellovibrionales bacterium]|nr:hypothetical protein [Bdellovibrionales bacterium]